MGKLEVNQKDDAKADNAQYPELLKKIRAQQAEDAKRAATARPAPADQDKESQALPAQPASIQAH